jgi:hypothetical protein
MGGVHGVDGVRPKGAERVEIEPTGAGNNVLWREMALVRPRKELMRSERADIC